VSAGGEHLLLADTTHYEDEFFGEAEGEAVRYSLGYAHAQDCPDLELNIVPFDNVGEFILLRAQPSEQVDVVSPALASCGIDPRNIHWLDTLPSVLFPAEPLHLVQDGLLVVEPTDRVHEGFLFFVAVVHARGEVLPASLHVGQAPQSTSLVDLEASRARQALVSF